MTVEPGQAEGETGVERIPADAGGVRRNRAGARCTAAAAGRNQAGARCASAAEEGTPLVDLGKAAAGTDAAGDTRAREGERDTGPLGRHSHWHYAEPTAQVAPEATAAAAERVVLQDHAV
jgi:hypothetical protein